MQYLYTVLVAAAGPNLKEDMAQFMPWGVQCQVQPKARARLKTCVVWFGKSNAARTRGAFSDHLPVSRV